MFQGEPGANSHIACLEVFPDCEPVPQPTFEDCFQAVDTGEAELAMIPIENSVAGRVADIHHLLPTSELSIIGEHFLPVHHQLLGVLRREASRTWRWCRATCRRSGSAAGSSAQLGVSAEIAADTAGSARYVAELGDPKRGALRLAPCGGDLRPRHPARRTWRTRRTTRRASSSCRPRQTRAPARNGPVITTFIFRVRNVPAALYKALGGFATNGINMTKLESYQLGGKFFATLFYADVEGHPDDHNLKLAMEELEFFSAEFRIVGVYPASSFRAHIAEPAENRDNRPHAPAG